MPLLSPPPPLEELQKVLFEQIDLRRRLEQEFQVLKGNSSFPVFSKEPFSFILYVPSVGISIVRFKSEFKPEAAKYEAHTAFPRSAEVTIHVNPSSVLQINSKIEFLTKAFYYLRSDRWVSVYVHFKMCV